MDFMSFSHMHRRPKKLVKYRNGILIQFHVFLEQFLPTVFIVKKRKRYKWKNKKVDMNYAWVKKDVIEKFLGFS